MVTRALLIVDQLPFAQLALVKPPPFASQRPLALDYLPRTTPVGHTTISTGMQPSAHLVQGREWCQGFNLQNIDHLPDTHPDHGALTSPLHVERILRTSSLGARIRRQDAGAGIVIAAAKSFIPFVLGAWDADVAIYPTSVRPFLVGRHFKFVVLCDPRTPAGATALRALQAQLEASFAVMMGRFSVPGATTSSRWNGQLELEWRCPARSPPDLLVQWVATLNAHAAEVDQWYGDSARLVADALQTSTTWLIHSWFSSDWYGHQEGVGSAFYLAAVQRALDHADALHRSGAWVVVTSDHGGRRTPQPHLHYERRRAVVHTSAGTRGLPLGVYTWLLSGDHLVAYSPQAASRTHGFTWSGGTLVPVSIPPSLLRNSFHRTQVPELLLLPGDQERISARPGRGGGDHGACADAQARLSPIDNEVPLLTLGPPGNRVPTRLAGVSEYFLEGPGLGSAVHP